MSCRGNLAYPLICLALLATLATSAAAQVEQRLPEIRLPDGFKINVFARVPNARSMAVANELGLVFVGTRRGDKVYALLDRDRNGQAENVVVIDELLRAPNGIAWRDGYLYVAEQHQVSRYRVRNLPSLGRTEPEVIFRNLPNKSRHGWRYIAFDPQGRLHITVGSPCNICEGEGIEGTIIRLTAAGGAEVVAKGVRNSVGMDFHPGIGELYFTDNGADGMGDDSPPDELNHVTRDGLHFGFPYFGGGGDPSPPFRGKRPPVDTTKPVVEFNAHVAALGMHFYRGHQLPADYRTDAFVAQHGSWNRSTPIGYRVMRIRMDKTGKVLGQKVFATAGFRTALPGDARSTSKSFGTARCWSPTTAPA